jgi:hypothetical protein
MFLEVGRCYKMLSGDNFQLTSLTTLKILDIFNEFVLQLPFLFLKDIFQK